MNKPKRAKSHKKKKKKKHHNHHHHDHHPHHHNHDGDSTDKNKLPTLPTETQSSPPSIDSIHRPTPPTSKTTYNINTHHNPLKTRRDLVRTPPIATNRKTTRIRTPPTPLRMTPPSTPLTMTPPSRTLSISFEKLEFDDVPSTAIAKDVQSPPAHGPQLWLTSGLAGVPVKAPTKIDFPPDSDIEDAEEEEEEEEAAGGKGDQLEQEQGKQEQNQDQNQNQNHQLNTMTTAMSNVLHPFIQEFLPRMIHASRRCIVEEDFISASALKRFTSMIHRRGKRMSQLVFVKQQAVSIENFTLAIQVVDKLDSLKIRTTDQLRLIPMWRLIEKERKEQEHQEQEQMEQERRRLEFEKEEEMDAIVQYDIGQWVECQLQRWGSAVRSRKSNAEKNTNTNTQNYTPNNVKAAWYRGQITSREEERIQSTSDVLETKTSHLRILSYAVRFTDVRMMKMFEMVGSTDVTGRIIEQIMPSELRGASGPIPPMERKKGEEYQRMRQKKEDVRKAQNERIQKGSHAEFNVDDTDTEIESNDVVLVETEVYKQKKKSTITIIHKYKLGEIVECKINDWPQWYGGRISRHDTTGKDHDILYSILFDDLSMQAELKSRVHRRIVEGINEEQVRHMPRRRLESYENQYNVHYGIRKTKEEIEMAHQKEIAARKPQFYFFGKVDDIFEAKLPIWNTWYAGRLTHKDEVIGTVSMIFDDVRLLETRTAVIEENDDHDHNAKLVKKYIDRPKWNRVVEDIPHSFVRPITTGRLRLYKELVSSLKLIKKKVKQKESDEYELRKKLKKKKQIGPKRKKKLHRLKEDTLFIGLRPSDLAMKLKQESDYLIGRALQGLPPPHLSYGKETKQSNTESTEQKTKKTTKIKKTITTQKVSEVDVNTNTLTVMDMPQVHDIVAVQLQGWKMEYVGIVTNVYDLEVERKKRTSMIKHSHSNDRNNSTRQQQVDLSILWTVDVKFDDFELSVDQKWNDGVTARVVIDLKSTDLVMLSDSRRQRYTFMKNIWLTRQKQQEQERQKEKRNGNNDGDGNGDGGDFGDNDEGKEEKEKKEQEQDANLSWSEKRDRDRRRAIKKFKHQIVSGKNWFEMPIELDEFGFPVPQDTFSDSDDDDDKEDEEDDALIPSFCIHR